MRIVSHCAAAALLGLSASHAWAATVVENSYGQQGGRTQKVIIEANSARMESGEPGRYMLLLLQEQKMYAIDTPRKQVIDMFAKPPDMPKQAPPSQPPAPPKVDAQLVKKADGPKIAGYATTQYQILANGQVCSNEFVSAEVMQLPDIQSFTKAMQGLAETRKKNAPMPFTPADPCLQAMDSVEAEFAKLGLSLRSTNKDGQVTTEIISITQNVQMPPDSFVVPQGFEMTTPFEMMQKAMQNMPKQGQGGQPQGATPPPAGAQPMPPQQPPQR
jgi:hypothetical protein